MFRSVRTDAIGLVTLVLVAMAWVGFGFALAFRKKPPRTEQAKRASVATWGIVIQGVAFGLVWGVHRPDWWPFSPSMAGELALAIVTVMLTYASAVWCLRAIQTLGKQWAYEARVVAGHELVTTGPFSIVRNPIYLGLLGLMTGVGLALSRWWAIIAAVVLFLIGNNIRIRAEESLLRAAFGARFDDYAARVPAFLPRLTWLGTSNKS